MAVTAHWMAENDGHLELKSALIAFQRVWGKHSAKNLANIMLRVLDRAGTTNKVSISASVFLTHSFVFFFFFKTGHITMDNLETNTKAMDELASLLSDREIPFDAKDRRVMCFPHIINIICQHVIEKMTRSKPPTQDDDDDSDSDDDSDDENQAAVGDKIPLNSKNRDRQAVYARDPINRCRKIIIAIRSSGQRREKFESWITTGEFIVLPL